MKNLYYPLLLTITLGLSLGRLEAQINAKFGTADLRFSSLSNPDYFADYGVGGVNVKNNNFVSSLDAFGLNYRDLNNAATLSANSLYLSASVPETTDHYPPRSIADSAGTLHALWETGTIIRSYSEIPEPGSWHPRI